MSVRAPLRRVCRRPLPVLLRGAFRFSEEIPNEENEINNDSLSKSSAEAKPEGSPPLPHKKVIPNSALPSPANHDAPIPVSETRVGPGSAAPTTGKHESLPQFDLPTEEFADFLPDGELLTVPLVVEEKSSDNSGPGGPVPSPSLDFNDNEDIPTELSDSSETHDEGTGMRPASETERSIEVTLCLSGEAVFHEDLNGRLHINEVFKFSVDKLYDILFTQSQFMSDFNVQRRISGELTSDPWAVGPPSLLRLTRSLCSAA